MTFLNPAILWGLFAVSVPIIIHIFNLKKTRKIEFSTLMFLKEIQETKQKRLKLKQLLILLCRIAFIMMLVTAFAGPLSMGFLGSITNKAPASVLILIDDSFSMSGRTGRGSNFESAKQKLNELLGTLDSDDEIYFMPVSQIDSREYHKAFKNANTVKDSAANLKLSDSRKNIAEILYKANAILANSKYPLKEIFLITDGQGSMYNKGIPADENIFGDNTRLCVILASNRTANNISIDSIDIKTKIFSPGRPVKLSASVKNHNNFNVANISVVFTTGSYRDEKVLDIPASSESEAEFVFMPTGTGFTGGKIEVNSGGISEDEFINDNSRNLVIYIPDELKILSVSQTPGDDSYINLAISSSETMTADSTGRQHNFYKVKSASSISGENPDEFNCVMLININSFTPEGASALKEFISNGGGAIIYPGKSSDINNYNEVLNRTLGLPYLPERTESNVVFEKADYNHPVFEGVFKTTRGEIKPESPSITSYISPQQGENSQTLISLNDGNNFLVHYTVGKGRILMYAIPPDNTCSDFPESAIFSPLVIRSIGFVSRLPEPKEAIAGDNYYFNPYENGYRGNGDSLTVFSPGKNSFTISPPEGINTVLDIGDNINTSGIYTVSSGINEIYEIPVNTAPEESLPSLLSPEEIEAYSDKQLNTSAEVIESSQKLDEAVREARTGENLWQYFLAAAIIFFGIEFWLAGSISKVKSKKIKITA